MAEQPIVIKPGMDENLDRRELPIGTPALLQNVRVREGARFEHRPGQQALVASGLSVSGIACWMGNHNGSPVAAVSEAQTSGRDESSLYAFNGARWAYLGRHGHCVPHRRFGVAGRERSVQYTGESVVAADGLLYVCYNDESGASDIVSIVEMTPEGTKIRSLQLVGEDSPRLVWTTAELLLITNAGGTVKVRTISRETFSFATTSSLAVAANSSATAIDAAALPGTNHWLATYASTPTGLYVARLTSGHSVAASNTILCTNTPSRYSAAGKVSESVVAVYADGTTAKASVFDYSLASPTGVTLQTLSGGETWTTQFALVRTSSSECHALLGGTGTLGSTPDNADNFTEHAIINSAAVTASMQNRIQHFIPAAKPLRVGVDGDASVYCWMRNGAGLWDDALNARHLLVKLEPTDSTGYGAQLAGVSYEHQAEGAALFNLVGSVADLGDGRFATILNWRDPGKFAGIDCVVFSLSTPSDSVSQAHRFTESAGGSLFVSGGALSDMADAPVPSGTVGLVPENNFAHAPVLVGAIASGGSMTAGSAYSYAACYRRIDSAGRVQRSAAGLVSTNIVATGSHRRASVYLSTLAISNQFHTPGEAVKAELYRSTNGGPYYYVAASDSVTPTSPVVNVVDGATDASIVDDDGALDVEGAQPMPPSGARLIKQWGVRLAAVGWRENEVQMSKTYRSDTSWEFVDEATFRYQLPDPITALGYLDGVGVAFTAKKLYACTGDGPTDDGRAGSFDPPRELPVSTGADSPHVVETPNGLMYKGGGTIWLLPRGFGPPQPVGDLIQRTLGAYPYLRAAFRSANNDDDLTFFLLASGDLPSSSTVVVVWDNRHQGWSRDQLSCDVGAAGDVGGYFHALLATWSALSQKPVRKLTGAVSDLDNDGAEVWPEMRVGFGDWRPFGPLGYGSLDKVQIHGERAGDCNLNLDVTIDGGLYSTTETQASYTVATRLTESGEFYREHRPRTTRGTSWRFDIYDSQASGVSSGLVVHSVAYEATQEAGLRRMSESEEF